MTNAFWGNNTSGPIDIATAVNAKGGAGRMDFESETFVTHTLKGEGFDASEDGTGRGVPLVPVAFDTTQITSKANFSNPQPGDPCHPLAAQAHVPAIVFSCKDSGGDAGDIAPTMRAMQHDGSHANAGGQIAVAIPILEAGARTGKSTDDVRAGSGIGHPGDPMFTLQGGKQHAVAFTERTRAEGRTLAYQEELAYALTNPGSGGRTHSRQVATQYAVRRLTVRECEVLQGLPPGYCAITGRPRKIEADEAAYLAHHGLHVWQHGEQWMTDVVADGPQYRAIGNGWAIPCVTWIAEKLQAADEEFRASKESAA